MSIATISSNITKSNIEEWALPKAYELELELPEPPDDPPDSLHPPELPEPEPPEVLEVDELELVLAVVTVLVAVAAFTVFAVISSPVAAKVWITPLIVSFPSFMAPDSLR